MQANNNTRISFTHKHMNQAIFQKAVLQVHFIAYRHISPKSFLRKPNSQETGLLDHTSIELKRTVNWQDNL